MVLTPARSGPQDELKKLAQLRDARPRKWPRTTPTCPRSGPAERQGLGRSFHGRVPEALASSTPGTSGLRPGRGSSADSSAPAAQRQPPGARRAARPAEIRSACEQDCGSSGDHSPPLVDSLLRRRLARKGAAIWAQPQSCSQQPGPSAGLQVGQRPTT